MRRIPVQIPTRPKIQILTTTAEPTIFRMPAETELLRTELQKRHRMKVQTEQQTEQQTVPQKKSRRLQVTAQMQEQMNPQIIQRML